jgi:hypothetical protein
VAPQTVRDHVGVRVSLLAATLAGTLVVGLAGAASPAGTHAAASRSQVALVSNSSPRPDQVALRSAPHPLPVPAAPSAAPVAPVAPAAPDVAVAAPAPVAHHNRLVSADGTLNTGVGYYSDCLGLSTVPHSVAVIDTCSIFRGRTYFEGHNPGVFTPLLHMGVGSVLTYFDGAGTAHVMHIVAIRTWDRAWGLMPEIGPYEFQTCISADGSIDRILDAVPA